MVPMMGRHGDRDDGHGHVGHDGQYADVIYGGDHGWLWSMDGMMLMQW